MNCWIAFFIGLLFGGTVGVIAMCIFTISGEQSHREREGNIDEL